MKIHRKIVELLLIFSFFTAFYVTATHLSSEVNDVEKGIIDVNEKTEETKAKISELKMLVNKLNEEIEDVRKLVGPAPTPEKAPIAPPKSIEMIAEEEKPTPEKIEPLKAEEMREPEKEKLVEEEEEEELEEEEEEEETEEKEEEPAAEKTEKVEAVGEIVPAQEETPKEPIEPTEKPTQEELVDILEELEPAVDISLEKIKPEE